ncbi:hypothetical protein EDD37DRAFT_479580 [Exophiala viscosa]|uniref:uncharacterized protein n=1 Tax=Exophiala viscosa TaxID=2486360 RepID=UPI002193B5F2|nr:hypothetical protein EDD37DRAFT_479580 [Exophiala viscosa]
MKKSFIERIFPNPQGSGLPQYEPEYHDSISHRSTSPQSPPRIALQDSIASTSHYSAGALAISHSPPSQSLGSSLVRHNDPFLPVERAAKNLERMLQSLLDAQSEGLSAGVGADFLDDASSMGSLTPTPSVATPSRATASLKTIPVRQPKQKTTTLREARRGLSKAMTEFAALKDWEVTLIDRQVQVRDDALKKASDLKNRKRLLDDEVQKIKSESVADSLRSEAENVQHEIQELEARLLELRTRHRHMLDQVRELESSRDSKLSSYTEASTLNENKIKSFLRQPPVPQIGVGDTAAADMYALKPERRTLQMAQDQWTSELNMLQLRRADVDSEKAALQQGSKLWREVAHRVREFERALRAQTKDMTLSQMQAASDGAGDASTTKDGSKDAIFSQLSALVTYLQDALAQAESKNWNLLICAIGAELVAFQEAQEALQPPSDAANGDHGLLGDEHQVVSHQNLMSAGLAPTNGSRTQSPGEKSNRSLEDTLREFGNGLNKGKQRDPEPALETDLGSLDNGSGFGPDAESHKAAGSTSESEDDDPGPEFLLSHT